MKILISFFVSFVSLFQVQASFAQSSYTLSGTYGCLLSPNFSGFVNRVTNGSGSSSSGNSLLLITFTSGSPIVSISGVTNDISNFEKTNATNTANIIQNATHFNYIPNSPVQNMYTFQDTSSTPAYTSYFIFVNSGKTMLGLDAPTVDKNNNLICQAL